MKARLLLLGLASAACAFGAYTYDYSATPLSYSSSQWSLNGTVDAATPATRFNSGGSYDRTRFRRGGDECERNT